MASRNLVFGHCEILPSKAGSFRLVRYSCVVQARSLHLHFGVFFFLLSSRPKAVQQRLSADEQHVRPHALRGEQRRVRAVGAPGQAGGLLQGAPEAVALGHAGVRPQDGIVDVARTADRPAALPGHEEGGEAQRLHGQQGVVHPRHAGQEEEPILLVLQRELPGGHVHLPPAEDVAGILSTHHRAVPR